MDLDAKVRLKAFQFLEEQSVVYRDAFPRETLARGFEFEGTRVPLVGPQGIFKPALLPEIPLTITTVPEVEGKQRPYDDGMDSNGLILYRYRGTDPDHRDNRGLRTAMERKVPLIYLFGVSPGWYLAHWPAYMVGDEPALLAFTVELAEVHHALPGGAGLVADLAGQRAYRTVEIQQRLHQRSFRFRVIQAYQRRCAICRLRHFVDAAHIIPDQHPRGEPWVSNGLALCKLHHAAFDDHIVGIRPDLIIEVRREVLDEADGPMLIHGLQHYHKKTLSQLPSSKKLQPRKDFLEERYELFRRAG